MAWSKGESGNPGGRPKLDQTARDVQELAREHSAACIEALAKIAQDEKMSPSSRIAAAIALLDRGWGKPAASIQNVGENGPILISWAV